MLQSYNNLGRLYLKTERYDAALPMVEKALEGRRKTLGVDHPTTLYTMTTLAMLRSKTGDLEGAAMLYAEAAELEPQPEHKGPPECVCQKKKPSMDLWWERKIKLDGAALNVFDIDADTGEWGVIPRGSSISDLTPDPVTGKRCTVVQSDTKFWCAFSSLFLHLFVAFSRTLCVIFRVLFLLRWTHFRREKWPNRRKEPWGGNKK